MSRLFKTTEINGMTLRNRFIRSATWEGMAGERGECSQKIVKLMARLVQGGVGLIITSHAFVSQDGKAGPRQLGIYDDTFIDGLRRMTDAVHKEGGPIVIQLAHAGFAANPKITGHRPVAPSHLDGLETTPRKVLTKEGIPICLVGGIRSFQVAEKLLEGGYADYISMSRPFIREPDLIKRWESGDRNKAACISDTKCFEPALAGEGIYCVIENRVDR